MKGSLKFISLFFILSGFFLYFAGCATTSITNTTGEKVSSNALTEDYQDWSNVFSKVDLAKGEFHRVLVGPESFATYKKGDGAYKKGDRLILEFSRIQEQLEGEKKVLVKGEATLITLMVCDPEAKETGGWRWFAFDGNRVKVDMDTKAGCYVCHRATAKENNLVCSKYPK